MAHTYIAFVLDFFQPSRQKYSVMKEIIADCYRPLVEVFNAQRNARFTVSLAKSVVEMLSDYGDNDVIDRLNQAVKSGHVELIHTAAYHSILPLLPEREVQRQIELDIDFKEEHFALATRSGVLSPEMGYDDRLIPIFQAMGFRWTVIDDSVMGMHGIEIPDRSILHVDDFAVLMRSSY